MSATPSKSVAPPASDDAPQVGPLGKLNIPAWLALVCAVIALGIPLFGVDWPLPLLLAPLAIVLGIIARGLANRGAAFGPVGTASFAGGILAILLLFVWVNLSSLGMGPYKEQPTNPEDEEPIEIYTDVQQDQGKGGPQPQLETLDLGS